PLRPTPELSPLSLHDALPISPGTRDRRAPRGRQRGPPPRSVGHPSLAPPHLGEQVRRCVEAMRSWWSPPRQDESENFDDLLLARSEEHTSELQSRGHLVCRLL